jgi:hypothetical protein
VRWSHAVVEDLVQNDFTYVAIMFALFAVAVLFVAFCDKIIGPDEPALTQGATGTTDPAPGVTEAREAA